MLLGNLPNELLSQIICHLNLTEIRLLLEIPEYRKRMAGMFHIITNHSEELSTLTKNFSGISRSHIDNFKGEPGLFKLSTVYLIEIKDLQRSKSHLRFICNEFIKTNSFISLFISPSENRSLGYSECNIVRTFIHEITKDKNHTLHVEITNTNPKNKLSLKNCSFRKNYLRLNGNFTDELELSHVVLTESSPMLLDNALVNFNHLEITKCSQAVIESIDFSQTKSLSIAEPETSNQIFKHVPYFHSHNIHCQEVEHYSYYNLSTCDFSLLETAHFQEFTILQNIQFKSLKELKLNLRFQTIKFKPATLMNLDLPKLESLIIEAEEVTPDLIDISAPCLKSLNVNVYHTRSKLGGMGKQTINQNNRQLNFGIKGANLETIKLTNCLDIIQSQSAYEEEKIDFNSVIDLSLTSTIGFKFPSNKISDSKLSASNWINLGTRFQSLKILTCYFQKDTAGIDCITDHSYLTLFLQGLRAVQGCNSNLSVTKNGVSYFPV